MLKWLTRHSSFRLLFAKVLAISGIVVGAQAAAGFSGPEVWFAPMDPIIRPIRPGVNWSGAVDYLQLFAEDAEWKVSAKYVSVFKLYPQFVNGASDDDLRRVLADLKRRGVKIGVDFDMLHPRATCGHIEGYGLSQIANAMRIQRLGGKVDYFAADEPLWFGNAHPGIESCHIPLPELAREAAETARAFRSIFPNVKFVDVEPVSNFQDPNWIDLISQWHGEFAKAFGEPFSAFTIDVNWQRPWRDRVAAITARLRSEGMPVSLICDGDPNETTDLSWINHALQRCEQFSQLTGAPPDMAIFQSWVPRPTRVLPENAPDSFTHLLLEYAVRNGVPPVKRNPPQ